MLIGVTCVSFFAMVLCYLSLTIQLPAAVAFSDYCKSPEDSQYSIVKMPGKLLDIINRKSSISQIARATSNFQS